MKDNLEKNPKIGWQYYISVEDTNIVYPAHNGICDIESLVYRR